MVKKTASTPDAAEQPPLLPGEDTSPEQAALAAVEHTNDVVEYTLRCVMALAPQLKAAIVRAAEAQVREVFGGDEVWVGRRPDLQNRNAAIRRDYLAGERVALLARRYDLTQRHVLRIIKGHG